VSPTDRIHQERAGRNQSLFREVNERIEGVRNLQPMVFEEFVCECCLDGCTSTITLTIEEYEAVRERSTWFAVLPGHVDLTVERGREDPGGCRGRGEDGPAGCMWRTRLARGGLDRLDDSAVHPVGDPVRERHARRTSIRCQARAPDGSASQTSAPPSARPDA
jgi:hypothetical protein